MTDTISTKETDWYQLFQFERTFWMCVFYACITIAIFNQLPPYIPEREDTYLFAVMSAVFAGGLVAVLSAESMPLYQQKFELKWYRIGGILALWYIACVLC